MRLNLILTFIIGIALAAAGCGGSTTPTGGSNSNVANTNSITNANSVPANIGLDTTKKPEAATDNNAPTIAPVVQTYYEALKKKDEALLKSVMSQEFIKN